MNKEEIKEPLLRLQKRTDLSKKRVWLIRLILFFASLFTCTIVSILFSKYSPGFFVEKFINGVFGTWDNVVVVIHQTALLLMVALAVTPCFKMKFWNIGGEGQILMGALGTSIIIVSLTGKVSLPFVIIISLISAIVFSVVWCLIPAFFKAFWNTNETLLTLMMNYIATCLTGFFIKRVATLGTGVLEFSDGILGPVFGSTKILNIIMAIVIMILIDIYFRFSKKGYEIAVVGESENTARYIGINTKKVILRTLALCGIISGIIGFLLVSATNFGLNKDSTVGGMGFTGVLISWLGNFNPFTIALVSFLFSFIQKGSSSVADNAKLGTFYQNIMTSIFFLFIVAVEFFINYKVVFRKKLKEENQELEIDKKEEVEEIIQNNKKEEE